MQPPYPVFLSWADRLGESGGWRSLSQTERWRTPRTRPSVPCRPAWPCPPPSRTWTSRSPPPHSSSQADSRYHTDGWGLPWPVPASSPGRGTTCWLSWWSSCCLFVFALLTELPGLSLRSHIYISRPDWENSRASRPQRMPRVQGSDQHQGYRDNIFANTAYWNIFVIFIKTIHLHF